MNGNGNGNGNGQRIEKILLQKKTPIVISFLAALAKVTFFLYDLVSYIPYKIFADPAKKLKKSRRTKAAPTVEGDNASPWRHVATLEGDLHDDVFGCKTVGEVWDESVKRFSGNNCFGTREILAVTQEKQKNGRFFEKLELGSYNWHTFGEADEIVRNLSKGLREIGLKKGDGVVIYSDTREEWMLTALACFKSNFPLVTVYASLGIDAVVHSINECEATTLVTTTALLPKVAEAVKNCKTVKTVIYFADRSPESKFKVPEDLSKSDLRVLHFDDVVELGSESDETPDSVAGPDDVAIVMYTSGTTGNPKGVVMLHKHLVAATAGQRACFPLTSNDVYVGYLPLAHILEVCAETVCIAKGCAIGYSSPQTLFDSASRLKKGQLGDCTVLQPTLIACIPAIMDRIFKAVSEKVANGSAFKREMFRICYERKRARYEEGYTSSLLNKLAFNSIQKMLGGKVRFMVSGGAPLNPETQRFMNICFGCPVLQGYGLTETCGGGTLGDIDDLSTGTVGAPLTCCDIVLREWTEGGYSPKNEKPQGEVLIGGENVALGYLKNEEKTKEDFIEMNGKRYFATGDIGEFREDGSLCIIDRKKDLLKLSQGEYVSLGKVESTLCSNPIVETICVYGDSNKDYVVALVVPKKDQLKKFADEVGLSERNFRNLCDKKEIKEKVLADIQSYGKAKLNKMEMPQNLYLCPEPWTPDSGLLTEALKLKRKNIEMKYRDQIAAMYR